MKLQETYDLLLKFERCANEAEVVALTLKTANTFGVERYLSGTMPQVGLSPNSQASHVLGGDWPAGWTNRYFQHGYLDKDPTIAHVRSSLDILVWNKRMATTEDARKIMREACAYGLAQGITVPQCSIDGFKIGTSFAGRHMEVDDPRAKTFLSVIAAYSVAATLRTRADRGLQKSAALTKRELEVLYWIADGKTGSEIGNILSIATVTVEKHFRCVLLKLGTNNRAHAVAEALRCGIIR